MILMSAAYRRHDISDEVWTLLESHLPGREGVWGGRARDNRQFINAVFWILRTGAPWRDYRPHMVIGRTHIADFAAGVTAAFGNPYWND